MTAYAVCGYWGSGHIPLDLIGVAMGVAVEIGSVTLGTGAAITTINRGVTTTVNPYPSAAVCRVVAGGARGMDNFDHIAGMAVDAKRGGQHCGAMGVTVTVKIGSMTTGAGSTPDDGSDLWPVNRVFERGRRGVTV